MMTQELANFIAVASVFVVVTVAKLWVLRVNENIEWDFWDSVVFYLMLFCTISTLNKYINTLPTAAQVQAMESRKASELKQAKESH